MPRRTHTQWVHGHQDSKTHVATMTEGDFYHNEKSVTLAEATNVRIEHTDSEGNITLLKDNLALIKGEIIDASIMRKKP